MKIFIASTVVKILAAVLILAIVLLLVIIALSMIDISRDIRDERRVLSAQDVFERMDMQEKNHNSGHSDMPLTWELAKDIVSEVCNR